MSTQTRRFHLSDILSITHDRLVSTRHMEGVYDISNFLTQDKLFTHQLTRVHAECKAHLFALHPQLNQLPLVTDEEILAMKLVNGKPAEWWNRWLDVQIARFGEFLEVTPIPKGIHEYKDPIEEAIEMVGPEKLIAVRASESPSSPDVNPLGRKT